MKIGLVGYGHFGQALKARFMESGFDADFFLSEGRGKNATLLAVVDVLLICVRPLQLRELAEELRPALSALGRNEKCLVSFAAAATARAQAAAFGFPVTRAMSDLQFKQILSTEEPRIQPLFQALSLYTPVELADENGIDDYTVLIACLAGVAAWACLHLGEGSHSWLRNYWKFICSRLSLPDALFEAILTSSMEDADPAETIHKMATPGGITEALVEQLNRDPKSSFEVLYGAGLNRCRSLSAAVEQSLTFV